MKNLILLPAIAVILLFSCKSDRVADNHQQVSDSLKLMKVHYAALQESVLRTHEILGQIKIDQSHEDEQTLPALACAVHEETLRHKQELESLRSALRRARTDADAYMMIATALKDEMTASASETGIEQPASSRSSAVSERVPLVTY